jgi:hypothetical protein
LAFFSKIPYKQQEKEMTGSYKKAKKKMTFETFDEADFRRTAILLHFCYLMLFII